MSTGLTYHERRVALTLEPLGVAASLAAGSSEPHVLYDNRGAVSWAEGDRIELSARADGMSMRVDDTVTEIAARGRPPEAIGRALDAVRLAISAPDQRLPDPCLGIEQHAGDDYRVEPAPAAIAVGAAQASS
jgi:hypothetical protein